MALDAKTFTPLAHEAGDVMDPTSFGLAGSTMSMMACADLGSGSVRILSDMDLIGTGRDADVYALDDARVLRRYRNGADVAAEVEVMRHVAAHGVPVPQVFEADGTDIVMERVDGRSLVGTVIAGEMDPGTAGQTVASLQSQLHAVPPRIAANSDDRILHLDLHPHNVMVAPNGPVLIDWRNASEGPPSLDVGMSALIMAEAALGSFVPAELVPAARRMLTAFLHNSSADPLDQMDKALEHRRADLNLTDEELGRLDDARVLAAETWHGVARRSG